MFHRKKRQLSFWSELSLYDKKWSLLNHRNTKQQHPLVECLLNSAQIIQTWFCVCISTTHYSYNMLWFLVTIYCVIHLEYCRTLRLFVSVRRCQQSFVMNRGASGTVYNMLSADDGSDWQVVLFRQKGFPLALLLPQVWTKERTRANPHVAQADLCEWV